MSTSNANNDARPRNRGQRTAFIQGFDRDLTSATRSQGFGGGERYVIAFNDGHALFDLTGVAYHPLLAERMESLSDVESADLAMDDLFEQFTDRYPDGPAIWVDQGVNFVLEPGDHLAACMPEDEYLDGMSADEIKQIADLLLDFADTCRQAALAYMRYCATHLITAHWPDGEDADPVMVVIDDTDHDLLALIDAAA